MLCCPLLLILVVQGSSQRFWLSRVVRSTWCLVLLGSKCLKAFPRNKSGIQSLSTEFCTFNYFVSVLDITTS